MRLKVSPHKDRSVVLVVKKKTNNMGKKGKATKGLERKGDGSSAEKKRMLILDQNKCKPGSEAFVFLQRISKKKKQQQKNKIAQDDVDLYAR